MKSADVPMELVFEYLYLPVLANTVRLVGRVHIDLNRALVNRGIPKQVTTAKIGKLIRQGYIERVGHKLWLTNKALTHMHLSQVI